MKGYNLFTVFMVLVVLTGFCLMVSAMSPNAVSHLIHPTSSCYNLLNAAHQVVDVVCH